jgi:phosphoenolpyruvate-protein kinase (PTS system EI component)
VPLLGAERCRHEYRHRAAIVTDGGTMAAHASLVAREYAIPAVVGTGTATTRLQQGQLAALTAPTIAERMPSAARRVNSTLTSPVDPASCRP